MDPVDTYRIASSRKDHNSWSAHFAATIRLALPLIGAQLAQIGIGVVDTVMVGQLGVVPLAAVGLGGSLFFVIFLAGNGLGQAVLPKCAEAYESRDPLAFRRAVRMGFWIVTFYALLLQPAFYFSDKILLLLGQDADLMPLTLSYLLVMGLSMLPSLWMIIFRSFLSAIERPGIILYVSLGMIAANAILNYLLIFGNWGFPALGVQGAALASLITNIGAVLVYFLYTKRLPELAEHYLFQRLWKSDWQAFADLFRLGLPISIAMLAEVCLFNISTIMMGWIGKVELATHVVVIQIAAVAFMVPLGLSFAATVRISQANDRRDALGIDRAGKTVVILGTIIAAFFAAIFILFPEPMLTVFIKDSDPLKGPILMLGAQLIVIVAIFQLADVHQILAAGLLRGFNDTKVPMYIAVFGFTIVGLPLGYILLSYTDLGAFGVWTGLTAGLFVAATLGLARFFRRDQLGLVKR